MQRETLASRFPPAATQKTSDVWSRAPALAIQAPGPGISRHGELRLMLRAGLSRGAAFAASSTPAGIFGIDDRWRIGESRSADLVLFDDYLAGRSLSDRETYLQVDPSGGRPGAACRVPTHRHDHEVGHCTGLPGRQSAGRRHRRGTAETPHAGRTHATSTAPPPISPHRLLLTGEFRHEAKGSSLRTFTNRAARTGQIVAYEYCPSGRRLFRVCPLKDSRFI